MYSCSSLTGNGSYKAAIYDINQDRAKAVLDQVCD